VPTRGFRSWTTASARSVAVCKSGPKAKATPMKIQDAIYQVPGDLKSPANHPYVNIIVARQADKNDPAYKSLVSAYHSRYVADAINRYYRGAAVPAFSY